VSRLFAYKIDISVRAVLGYFNQCYFTYWSKFWHISWYHGFRTPV